jgi:hypothetical protein
VVLDIAVFLFFLCSNSLVLIGIKELRVYLLRSAQLCRKREIANKGHVYIAGLPECERPGLLFVNAGTRLHPAEDPYRHAMMNTRK